MDIVGLWDICEVNAFDTDFNQVWRSVKDLEADPEVPPMQKIMAKQRFMFEPDGRFLQPSPRDHPPATDSRAMTMRM